jgi:hypothetical protein
MSRLETFIKVGMKVINIALVTDMDLHEGQVNIWLAAPGGEGKTRLIVLKGDDATVFGNWVRLNARDLSVAAEDAPKGADLVAF